MTDRYAVMDKAAALAAGVDWYGEDTYSILVDTATSPPTELGSDYGEPEDNSFHRDWKWVPKKLNEQDAAIAELVAGLRACWIIMEGCPMCLNRDEVDEAQRLIAKYTPVRGSE